MPENTTLPALPGSAFSRAKVAAWTPEAPVANYQLSVSEIIAAGKAGIYPDARLYVPRGVTGTGVIVPGSGGADGTYVLTWSGGNFTANPIGTFKVTGGRVMAVTITQPGLYVGASPTAPSATFTNSAGLSGASVPLTVNFLVNSGDAYWADHASDGDLYQLVRNVNGTATEMAGRTLPKNTDPIAGDIATVEGLVTTATTQAGIATTQAGIATTQAAGAELARDEAEDILADVVAGVSVYGIYPTYTAANAVLGSIPANAWVRVLVDENYSGSETLYQKSGGGLVWQRTEPEIVTPMALQGRSGGSRAQAIIIMDDGYRSNFTVMYPILKARGQVATIAAEVDRIGSPYTVTDGVLGTIAHPTCTAADYRRLIESGWQIVNHAVQATGLSLSDVIAGYKAENRLFQQILTGAKRSTGTLGVFTDGAVTHAQYDDYTVAGGIYRGGVNDQNTDNGGRYVYELLRDVPNPDQDLPFLYSPDGPKPQLVAVYAIDTTNQPLSKIMGMLEGLAATDATIILYGHNTPEDEMETTSPPSIKRSDLEAISRKIYELGIPTVTWGQAFPGNLMTDPRHDDSRATFTVAAGDTAAYQSATTYVGEARNVELTTTAYRANYTQTSASIQVGVKPFNKYRLRLGIVIPTDLTLSGGTTNKNHGLTAGMTTLQPFGGSYTAGASDAWTLNGAYIVATAGSDTSTSSVAVGRGDKSFTVATGKGFHTGQILTVYRTSAGDKWMRGPIKSYNSSTGALVVTVRDFSGSGTFTDWTIESWRCPYRATVGVEYHDFILTSGDGYTGTIQIGLQNAIGTVRIVHWALEDLGSYETQGLPFPSTFNTSSSRGITLPTLNTGGPRRRRWRAEVTVNQAAITWTNVTFAEVDSAAVAAPATGNTCYVLEKGAGDFANQGGMIGTWNGSAWTFAAPAVRSWIYVSGVSQGMGGGRRWFHRNRSAVAGALNSDAASDEPTNDVVVAVTGNAARVSSWTGSRSDAFILHAFPVAETMWAE